MAAMGIHKVNLNVFAIIALNTLLVFVVMNLTMTINIANKQIFITAKVAYRRHNMTSINELIETADKLCRTLEIVAETESKLCDDISLQLERYSWEVYRMKNSLQEIKQYVEG